MVRTSHEISIVPTTLAPSRISYGDSILPCKSAMRKSQSLCEIDLPVRDTPRYISGSDFIGLFLSMSCWRNFGVGELENLKETNYYSCILIEYHVGNL